MHEEVLSAIWVRAVVANARYLNLLEPEENSDETRDTESGMKEEGRVIKKGIGWKVRSRKVQG
jgi:hypothetical protein